MIYTVTFNPAVDYVIFTDGLKTGCINRSIRETAFVGGKGINVSRMLKTLGVESTALGFIAGFTGNAVEHGLKEEGIKTDFVRLPSGLTRINVKIRSGEETDINAQGPDISEDDVKGLMSRLDALSEGDILVLAGSIPSTLPPDIYERIMSRLSGRGILFAVDAEGELLVKCLPYKPFLIKPNNDELSEIFGVKINTVQDAEKYSAELRGMGAGNVIVSMGGGGALLCDSNGKTFFESASRGEVKNTVGAGDSMVAGFIAGYTKGLSLPDSLRLGSAAGSATAFSEGLGDKEMIEKLLLEKQQKNSSGGI